MPFDWLAGDKTKSLLCDCISEKALTAPFGILLEGDDHGTRFLKRFCPKN